MTTYAIIDFETTGLNPLQDRVLEIGAAIYDQNGTHLRTFDTILNPGRNVGPTEIHRITSQDVTTAPTFEEVAQHLSDFLHGSYLVSHNKHFDHRFLAAEYDRLGLKMSVDLANTICTMTLGREAGLTGKLNDMLQQLKLHPNQDAHRALVDVHGAAAILFSLRPHLPALKQWNTRDLYDSAPTSTPSYLTREMLPERNETQADVGRVAMDISDTYITFDAKDEIVLTANTLEENELLVGPFSKQVESLGLSFHPSIRKSSTQALVTVDPYSQSAKVQNAVRWGIPIFSLADWSRAVAEGRVTIAVRENLEDVPEEKLKVALAAYLTQQSVALDLTSKMNSRFGTSARPDQVMKLVEKLMKN